MNIINHHRQPNRELFPHLFNKKITIVKLLRNGSSSTPVNDGSIQFLRAPSSPNTVTGKETIKLTHGPQSDISRLIDNAITVINNSLSFFSLKFSSFLTFK
jgi:hypothetical protein